MKQDRFLMGILVGIAVLVLAALVVFFTRQQQTSYRPEIGPDDVVHNYVLAVLNKDYQRAYGYLADLKDKPTFDDFRRAFATGRLMPGEGGIKIGSADVAGSNASVEVIMVYSGGDPFSSGYNNVGEAQLVLQSGAWKISAMPTYNLWDFSWYQSNPKY